MKVLFTIDVEVGDLYKNFSNYFEFLVQGGNQKMGTPEIIRLLNKYGFVGHFFVDIYGNKVCNGAFDDVVRDILAQKSKAYLHVHPRSCYDEKRPYMYQYSYSEQSEIIEDGVREWKRITGCHPLGFRAGSYSADDSTLKVLVEKGFSFDSSYFLGRDQCKIKDPNIIRQIPINSFIANYSFMCFHKKRLCKPDVNWLNFNAFQNMINIYKDQPGYVMIFLHSFSFLNLAKASVNFEKIREFEKLLQLISDEKIECVNDLMDTSLHPVEIKPGFEIKLSFRDVYNYFVGGQM